MALSPGEYLPVANKTGRTIEVFYVDAIISLSITKIITVEEASILLDKVNVWVRENKVADNNR